MDFYGKKALVMGLGRFGGGVGVSQWLYDHGADVTVTDMSDEASLQDSINKLSDRDITFRLGTHNISDFTTTDILVVNPAVPRENNRYIRAAQAAGVHITSEIELLLQNLPNRQNVIPVTGTAGKSTVCAMLGHALNQSLQQQDRSTLSVCWVGGNIGGSLLNHIDEISEHDYLVLELSSFMLQGMKDKQSQWGGQQLAIITNFSANHLDWHGSINAYRIAKHTILDGLASNGTAILGPNLTQLGFTLTQPNQRLVEVSADTDLNLLLPGNHNRINAQIVKTTLQTLGHWNDASRQAVESFQGLPHRMQFVSNFNHAKAYNDSKCTTVEGAILAMHSFPQNTVHLILGGYDKGDDYQRLGQEAAKHCAGIYAIGQVADRIIATASNHPNAHNCGDLPSAINTIHSNIKPDQVILLSPGCASWGQFDNYEQRGNTFIELLKQFA